MINNFDIIYRMKGEKMRVEKDSIGEMEIEEGSYAGIHTLRARENFKSSNGNTSYEIIRGIAIVKRCAAIANNRAGKMNEEKCGAIVAACDEILSGKYREELKLPRIQGGAGTSTNMCLNEVIANIALEKLGKNRGEYQFLNPLEDVNMSQSTNDVYPTGVKIAAIKLLRELVEEIKELQKELQEKEHKFASVYKLGRTQLKDAVPITLGQEFGAYAEALSRDRWRLYKAEERIRVVNIGGTAIGTGVGAPIKYRFAVTDELKKFTGYGIARAENLIDCTQNADVFVEVSGLLKSYSVNLSKIANDLRLMDSGPVSGLGEIVLPKLQAGSSIMPNKYNPVGVEFVKQVYFKVIGNDCSITAAAAEGEFELNPMIPLIAELLIENIEILRECTQILREKVIKGIEADSERCREYLEKSPSVATLLIEKIGYEELTSILKESEKTGKNYKEIIEERAAKKNETK